jgi:hypothetical protein
MERDKKRIIALILAVLIVMSWASYAQNSSANRKADEEDIFALVVRSQMEKWIHDGDKNEAEAKDRSDKAIAKTEF